MSDYNIWHFGIAAAFAFFLVAVITIILRRAQTVTVIHTPFAVNPWPQRSLNVHQTNREEEQRRFPDSIHGKSTYENDNKACQHNSYLDTHISQSQLGRRNVPAPYERDSRRQVQTSPLTPGSAKLLQRRDLRDYPSGENTEKERENNDREAERDAPVVQKKKKKTRKFHDPLPGGPVNAEKPGAYGIAGTYQRYRDTLIYTANWGTALHDQVKSYTEKLCRDRLLIGEQWKRQDKGHKQEVINDVVKSYPFIRDVKYEKDWPVSVMSPQHYITYVRRSGTLSLARAGMADDAAVLTPEVSYERSSRLTRSISARPQTVEIEPVKSESLKKEVESEEELSASEPEESNYDSDSTYHPDSDI